MNHFEVQQNAFLACEETRSALVSDHRRETVVCPKPRRMGMLVNQPVTVRPFRCYMSNHESEACQTKAGADLLDAILMKDYNNADYPMTRVPSSPPPFFCGSPPSRSGNPVVQDARFGDGIVNPLSGLMISSPSGLSPPPSSSSSSACKGGFVRGQFGLKPAAVRVEGFDCLTRDRKNSSITVVA